MYDTGVISAVISDDSYVPLKVVKVRIYVKTGRLPFWQKKA